MITLPVAATLCWACFTAALLFTIYGFYIGQVGVILIPIGFCLLLFMVCHGIFCGLSYNLNKWQREKKQIGKFVRRRNCMMIGFATVFLISMVGKVASFFLRNTTDLNPFVLVLLILAVYYAFTFTFDITYYNACSKCNADFWAIISIIASLHGFLLYYTVIKALEFEGHFRFVVVMWQVVFSVTAATSSIDIYIYAKGNIGEHEERKKEKNEKKEEVPLESVKVEAKEPEPKVEETVRKSVEPKEPTVVILINEGSDSKDSDSEDSDSAEEDTIPYCDTCYDDYSDSRIPRILTKCGHTICEECAKGLLRGNGIKCPYCKKMTAVSGPVNSLPKNFALMDIVEREMKKYYVE